MNKCKIVKLTHISKIDNKLETTSDIVMNAHIYKTEDIVMNYLTNFQNISQQKIYSANEYMQFYSSEESVNDEWGTEMEFLPISISNNNFKIHRDVERIFENRMSCREFNGEIEKSKLFALLDCVLKNRKKKSGEYHRAYPSGGALYPIKILLQISGVEGIKDGLYLYENEKNGLVYCENGFSGADIEEILRGQKITFGRSKVLILFLYDFLQNYIKYYDISLSLAFIEVGAISQSIQLVAPGCNIGYCDIGGFPKSKMERKLKLNQGYYHIVHVAIMGGVS